MLTNRDRTLEKRSYVSIPRHDQGRFNEVVMLVMHVSVRVAMSWICKVRSRLGDLNDRRFRMPTAWLGKARSV
jgi:hypothetical protein